MKGSIYVFASGNGGRYHDSCAADGYVNSIYTIAVGSADQNGEQADYDEDCSAKMAITFSHNSGTATSSTNQLVRQYERPRLEKEGKKLCFCIYTQFLQYTTALNGQCSDSFTGTSASAPMLAGVVSLTLEAK